MPTGGEALVAGLRELGVDVAFGLPGVHNLAAWKAFPGSGVRLVGVRHEQAAGYAADGFARATGRLGVALTTTGPGAANIVAATGEAWASHSPLLVIATDIPQSARVPGVFSGVLHETTDQASFFRPVTKAQVRIEDAADLHDVIVRAGRLAMVHPRRPVYVEIPTDLLSAPVLEPEPETHQPPAISAFSGREPFPHSFSRPLVWAGGGATAASAGPLIDQLCRRLGAPLLTSYGGRGLLPPDHPHLVPLPPHTPEAGALWDEADLVVVVGSDLDAMNTQGFRQPRPPWVVTVDLAHPVNLEPDVHIPLDAVDGLQLLLEALAPEDRTPWFSRPAGRDLYAGPETAFLDAFESGLTEDTVVVADMCIPGYWYGGFGRVQEPRGLSYPVGWGTLGFGFPAGIGAALSGRPAVALVGDGG
ncbi:MAG: thiamine pyrophosphate protein central region, partial [Frankiales bacterium]|nr:thiamine pyrophosphate protein central region [Frankiales bacterium]